MKKDTFDSWEKLLNPEKLKDNLIKASLYLSAYEVFKNSILDHLRGFFANHWKLNEITGEIETIISEDYKIKVKALYPRDEFHACCLWFLDNKAINHEDMEAIPEIRKHRNFIAHELPKIIGSADHEVDTTLFIKIIEIITKIDQWWIMEIEVPTNPDFDDMNYDEINWEGVTSGTMILLDLLRGIYEKNDAFLNYIYSEFANRYKNIKG